MAKKIKTAKKIKIRLKPLDKIDRWVAGILFTDEMVELTPDDRIIEVQKELDYYVLGDSTVSYENFKILGIWVEEVI